MQTNKEENWHVAAKAMERPEAAFARPVGTPRHFDEAIVEAQWVPYWVLPTTPKILNNP